jgi:hypothetical protein
MKLFLTTSTMNTEPVLESLPDAGRYFYDKGISPPDREMLDMTYAFDPEVVLYIGCTGGPHLPSASSFARMRKAGRKTVCLAFDASDESWHPHLAEFKEKGSFDLVVNIDGNDAWPRVTERDFTALTPIAAKYWEPHWLTSLDCRPVRFGFAGGYASPSRAHIVTWLQKFAELQIPVRNERFGTYQEYADFMMSCRVALSVPWSGVSEVGQVKGRVLEAGWAGCCLLEHVDSPTKHWFTPGVDYAVYRDRNEALMAIHQTDRGVTAQKMADNLSRRVRAEHSAEIFWGRVWEALK